MTRGIVRLGVGVLRPGTDAANCDVLAITAIAGVELGRCVPADLGMLAEPVWAHPAKCMFLADPIPAFAEIAGRGASGLDQGRDDLIDRLAAAEQGGTDRDLGRVDPGVAGGLIAHGRKALLDVDRRLEAEPAGDGEPRISITVRAVHLLRVRPAPDHR